jgi:hypothetical protein
LGGFTAKEGLFMFGWATRRALIRVTRQRPTKNGNSASEGLSMDRKSSEIFAAIERRLRADQEEGNHSAWAAAGSVDSSLNLLGVRSPSERAFKASIIEGGFVSSRMAGTPAEEEIDEPTGKFLRPRSDIASFRLLAYLSRAT